MLAFPSAPVTHRRSNLGRRLPIMVALFFILAATVGLFPVQRHTVPAQVAPAQALPATPIAAPYVLPTELLGKPEVVAHRGVHHATFDVGNGTYATLEELAPIHYQDKADTWRPINSAFAAVPNGWSNVTNSIQTSLAQRTSSAKVGTDALGIGWEPQALVATNATSIGPVLALPLETWRAQPGERSKDGRTVRYLESWSAPDIADQWYASPGSSEYSLRLATLPEVSNLVRPHNLDLRVQLHLQPGTTLQLQGQPAVLPLETGDTLEFVGADGETLLLQPPMTFEQADRQVRVRGSYRIEATADPSVIMLSVRTPWRWIQAPERRFPIVVDPLFQMRSPTEAKSAGYRPDQSFEGNYTPAPLEMGQFEDGVARLLVRFAMPNMPSGTSISKSYLLATPNDQNFLHRDSYVSNVQGYRLTSSAWTTNNGAQPQHQATPVLPPTPMRFGRGEAGQHYGTQWDVTALAQEWFNNASTNHGVMLITEREFCPQSEACAGFYFASPSTWSDAELQSTENSSTPDAPSIPPGDSSGVRLLVYYSGPTLAEGGSTATTPPRSAEPYFHADHEYRLNATPARWQALVTRGIGTSFEPDPSDPTKDGLPLLGTVPLELRSATETKLIDYTPALNNVGYILLNGRSSPNQSYRLRVKPTAGEPQPIVYEAKLVAETENINNTLNNTTTRGYSFDSGDALKLWNVVLPAGSNSRVDVLVFGTNEFGSKPLYNYARGFTAQLFHQSAGAYAAADLPNTLQLGSNAPTTGAVPYGSVRLSTGIFTPQAGNYGLALSYSGPRLISDVCIGSCSGEFPPHQIDRVFYNHTLRVTSCDAASGSFPTAAGICQAVRCPTSAFPVANYREAGNLGLWAASGWSGQTTVDGGVAPMIGGTGQAAPRVAVVGGTISYSGSSVTLSTSSSSLLVDCGAPTNASNPVPNYFAVYDGPMRRSTFEFFGTSYVLVPDLATGGGSSHVDPWRKADRDGGDLSSETVNVFTNGPPLVLAQAQLRRSTPTNLFFDTAWTLGITGWPSLTGSVDKAGNEVAPPIAGLGFTIGTNLSLDTSPAGTNKAAVRTFNGIRSATATVQQPATLGGAFKQVQAVILPRGEAVPSDPPQTCAGSCIDLRGPNDAANKEPPDRVWSMPDVHTNVAAGTVVMQREGEVLAYSTDHPKANPQAISQEFSFDAFNASVSIQTEKCLETDTVESTVVRGETRMTLPNMGDGTNPDNVIAASFKLCNTSLRQVHMEFHSQLGIPVGNSGLFITGLSGTVDLLPDYTKINFGLDFQAAQGGDGGAFKGHGDVTIDTRGLFAFQGTAKILGTVDADGKLWAAWSPLDIGFEMNLRYKNWLRGFARAHLWKGQGWQNKYAWLPDNPDETHVAAQIGATITIKEGQAFSWWFIDIPPDDIDFSIEIAFGQFCTNGPCSTYEWGVKGKFSIVGYDVGLYYGFDHGFDFILGNDDHILIDQYGGVQPSPVLAQVVDGLPPVAIQAAQPAIDGVATETFEVKADAENLLFALGWQAGAPQVKVFAPDDREIKAGDFADHTAAIATTTDSTLLGVQFKQPLPGTWRVEISNLSPMRTEHYKFVYFANKGAPGTPTSRGAFTKPATANEAGTGSYTIQWDVPVGTPDTATISLRYHKRRPIFIGDPPPDEVGNLGQAVPIVQNLPFKNGSYTWNTSTLANGTYIVSALVDDGINSFPTGTVTDPDDTCQPSTNGLPAARAWDPNRFAGTSAFTATGTVQIADGSAPGVPSGISLTPVDGAILAKWNPSPDRDVAAYLVRWGFFLPPAPPTNLPSFIPQFQQRVTATQTPTLRLGGLFNGVLYGMDIAAIDASGNRGQPSFPTFTTPSGTAVPVPSAPILFALGNVTSESATFAWTPGAGPAASSFRLVYTRLDMIPETKFIDTDVASATAAGLVTGATYEASVSAANSAGWRSVSTEAIQFVVTNGVDANSDGLPEDWALHYGVAQGAVFPIDPDGDGLTNQQEFQLKTDPTLQDTDGDGFSDAEERTANTNAQRSTSYPTEYTQPRLTIEQDRLIFHVKKQTGELTAGEATRLSNGGGGTLPQLAATSVSPWITADVFSISGRGTFVTVGVDGATLEPGFHSGVVHVRPTSATGPLIGPASCIRVETWVSPADENVPALRLFLPVVTK